MTRFDKMVSSPRSRAALRRAYDRQGKVRLNARKDRLARKEAMS